MSSNVHEIWVSKGEQGNGENVWRNNKRKKFKVDKNYKPVDSGNSMNSKHENHEGSYKKIQYNE